MSQRDLVAELRSARITAPPQVRERVRLIAAAAGGRGAHRLTWRRGLVVLVPIAAAVAAAIVLTRPSGHASDNASRALVAHGSIATALPSARTQAAPATVPSTPSRAQRYGAFLQLRVPTSERVSDGVKQALRIAGSLGGHSVSVHVISQGRSASADLVLEVPRTHVQEAIGRLARIGTIVGEQIDVQDLQAGLNATDRTITRLQRRLATLRAQDQTEAVKHQIAALTAQVVRLQRTRATTIRTARFATVQLTLSTRPAIQPVHHHGHGPLHGLGVAFRWIGIGLVYALGLGAPAAAVLLLSWLGVRAIRRRRVEALLSRP
jgi:hypothetical protein